VSQATNPLPLTDDEFEIADRLEDALEGAASTGMTPSVAARKAHTDTVTARRILDYLVRNQYAHTSGNGAWTRYHARRR